MPMGFLSIYSHQKDNLNHLEFGASTWINTHIIWLELERVGVIETTSFCLEGKRHSLCLPA
jgi:hypothetical protein